MRNDDGTIMAKIPTSWVKIAPKRELSPEAREKMAEQCRAMLAKRNK